MFVDKVTLTVQAGSGGNGCDSYFHRLDKKTVPNGGDGGRGGRVIFRADASAPGLGNFRFHSQWTAESGGHGGSEKKRGRNGKDLVITVQPGTKIFDRQRNFLIRHLVNPGEEVVVLEGGREGRGNQGGRPAIQGERGPVLELELRATLHADVFMIGLPNSGKSKLLNALTRAQVKEEAYPFTTQAPQRAVIPLSDYESLTLCEMPSLYKVSHEGRGMGTDFLKHLDSAKFLLLILDPVSEFAGSLKEGWEILREQIKMAGESFLNIPYAVAVNKMDLPEAKTKADQESFSPDAPVFYISALTGQGLDSLTDYLHKNVLKV